MTHKWLNRLAAVGGLSFALLTTFCQAAPVSPDPSEIWLSETNDGQRVELRQGQTLGVNLAAQPSTGYSWQVVEADPRILQIQGDPEFQPESSALGGPERQLMRWRVIGQGELTLKLGYERPWEKTQPPLRSFSIQLVAK